MVIPLAVKVGDPAFGWCDQFKRTVVANTGEAWTAGDVVVHDQTNGRFNKSSSQKQVGVKAIVGKDKPTTDDLGLIYLAPAIVYSKYIPAAALKNFSLVQCAAAAGTWEAKTADAAYADMIHTVSFAQVMGKAGQGGGSGFGGNDYTDIAQNEIVRLRLF
jgi:hypothetical protein